MIKIIIPNQTLPSWNKLYAGKHWAVRKEMADYWHDLVGYSAVEQNAKHIVNPGRTVEIAVTCYFRNYRETLDPDNICIKLAIDGLKGVVISDDDFKHVRKVSAESRTDSERPRTEILISYI